MNGTTKLLIAGTWRRYLSGHMLYHLRRLGPSAHPLVTVPGRTRHALVSRGFIRQIAMASGPDLIARTVAGDLVVLLLDGVPS